MHKTRIASTIITLAATLYALLLNDWTGIIFLLIYTGVFLIMKLDDVRRINRNYAARQQQAQIDADNRWRARNYR